MGEEKALQKCGVFLCLSQKNIPLEIIVLELVSLKKNGERNCFRTCYRE